MTAKTDLLPLPEPVAVKYPDSGLRDDEHALRLWAAHGYDTGGEPLFSAEQLREATAPLQAEIEALRAENERLREANAEMQKQMDRAWNDGFDFAMKGCGWQEGEDPSTEGLYVVRDSKGNVEVGMWYAKTPNYQPAEWTREFRDVDRDDIVAWMAIPDWRTARDASKLSDAMLKAREASND